MWSNAILQPDVNLGISCILCGGTSLIYNCTMKFCMYCIYLKSAATLCLMGLPSLQVYFKLNFKTFSSYLNIKPMVSMTYSIHFNYPCFIQYFYFGQYCMISYKLGCISTMCYIKTWLPSFDSVCCATPVKEYTLNLQKRYE